MSSILQVGSWKAGELFSIETREPRLRRDTGESAFPIFNLRFKYNGKSDLILQGGGIYSVHYRKELLYIGILTGKNKIKFCGNVAEERFWKHLEAQTMRGRSVGFTANNYKAVSAMRDHPLINAIRFNRVLESNGAVKSYPRKVEFAIRYWEEMMRIEEDPDIFDNFVFCYGRILPEVYDSKISYHNLKKYLGEIENRLILDFAPPCNGTGYSANDKNLTFGPPSHNWRALQELIESHMNID